jgi:GNAT superfamily N-acetyltransferase
MIRPITPWDYEDCVKILEEFALVCGLADLIRRSYDYKHVNGLLKLADRAGVSLISRDELTHCAQGIILSIPQRDIWCPELIRLRELAWYVRPEYRELGIGQALLDAYENEAKKRQNQGKIHGFCLTKLANSPEIDLKTRGYFLVESTYMGGL